jgi:sugar (pentulose or hexulose) kinase
MALTGVSTTVMSGGAVRHTQWVETMATILGLDVTVAPDAHLTVRGAARLAARGVGNDLSNPPVGRTVEPRSDIDIEEPLRIFEAAVSRYFDSSG